MSRFYPCRDLPTTPGNNSDRRLVDVRRTVNEAKGAVVTAEPILATDSELTRLVALSPDYDFGGDL
nr:hypothetical protein JVH1_1986 [Rhodococcus sp. JVH1]